MTRLGIFDEEVFSQIPIPVRARMISAQEGPRMLRALAEHDESERIRKNANKNKNR